MEVAGATVLVVPAEHDGTRGPWSRPGGRAVGYVVEGGGVRAYVAGDTDLFYAMADIGALGLDLAVLPAWGWGPTLGAGHLDPTRAASALRLLRPRVAVPYHWGTLWPSGLRRIRDDAFSEPGREFVASAAAAAPDVDVRLLHPGGSTSVGKRSGAAAVAEGNTAPSWKDPSWPP